MVFDLRRVEDCIDADPVRGAAQGVSKQPGFLEPGHVADLPQRRIDDLELGTDPLVASEVASSESARSVSQFLLAQIRKQIESDESPAIAAMREIAGKLWSMHRETFTHADGSELSFLSLNSWPGELASYWLTEGGNGFL